jgi:hypothetical protein
MEAVKERNKGGTGGGECLFGAVDKPVMADWSELQQQGALILQ